MRVRVIGSSLIQAEGAEPGVEISDEEWREYLDHLTEVADWEIFIRDLEREQRPG